MAERFLQATRAGLAAFWNARLARRQARAAQRQMFYRHTLAVRVMHWTNAVVITIMLMSGLQIFNATPALYWGKYSDFAHPLLAMHGVQYNDGSLGGVTQLGPWTFNTTGVLGL